MPDENDETTEQAERDQRASKQEGVERGDESTPPKPGGGKPPEGGSDGTEVG